MATGIIVSDEALASFENLKFKREYRYIIFRLSDDLKEVVTEHIGLSTESWSDMVARLPEDHCRYVMYGLSYENSEGHRRSKLLVLILPTFSLF
jgi:cofilin